MKQFISKKNKTSATNKTSNKSRNGAFSFKSQKSEQPFFSPSKVQSNSILKQSNDNNESRTPAADAVSLIKANNGSTGATILSEGLVLGILQAEDMFLKNNPLNRLSESIGLSGTIGPGQLGSPAVAEVDNRFSGAITAFANIYGAVPSSWENKATDANWSRFYTAAYLAHCINRGEQLFHSSPEVMSNADLGVLPLGIAIYHGAFETIRNMRRRIAKERNLGSNSEVTWTMVQEELRGGTATPKEMKLERYTKLVEGSWDFNFDIKARLPESRRFQVQDGKLQITILANYQNAIASGDRGNTFKVQLRKYTSVSTGGMVGKGFDDYASFTYQVGSQEVKTWNNLPKGEYAFLIEKNEKNFSPDRLIGQGTAKTRF